MRRAAQSANRAALCPSCERFIGPSNVCPYCNADSASPPILRVLRVCVVVLAVTGLACLYLAARNSPLPSPAISEITQLMNSARVSLEGKLAGNVKTGRRNGEVAWMTFLLDDGSGSIRIFADRRIALELMKSSAVPTQGARISVVGTVSAGSDGDISLRLSSSRDLTVLKPANVNREKL